MGRGFRPTARYVLALSFLWTRSARADERAEDEVTQADDPLPPFSAVNLQNFYIPSTYGVAGTGNNFLLRPILSTRSMLMRATVPISTMPTGDGADATSGLGDTNVFDIFRFRPSDSFHFGVGPYFVLPTATNSALGAGKWQAGAAGGFIFLPTYGVLLASLITYSHSFAGDSARQTQSALSPQIIVTIDIGGGFSVRSTPTWKFDLVSGNFAMPFGAGVGKSTRFGRTRINASIEPQYTIFHHGTGQPALQIESAINFQFLNAP